MGSRYSHGIHEGDRREIVHGIHVVGGQIHSLVVEVEGDHVKVLEEGQPDTASTPDSANAQSHH